MMVKVSMVVFLILFALRGRGQEVQIDPRTPKTIPGIENLVMFKDTVFERDTFNTLYSFKSKDQQIRYYSLYYSGDVCESKICKLIQVLVYWDAVGEFEAIMPMQPLTKKDDELFEAEDYRTLDDVLGDRNSFLKDYEMDRLYADEAVDAKTGATRTEMQGQTVNDAFFTTYTCWHLVYGFAREYIRKRALTYVNSAYIDSIFALKRSKTILSTLCFLTDFKSHYKEGTSDHILNLFLTDNSTVFSAALNWFEDDELLTDAHLSVIIRELPKFSITNKYLLFERLGQMSHLPNLLVTACFKELIDGRVSSSAFPLIIQLLEKREDLTDSVLLSMLSQFAKASPRYMQELLVKSIQDTQKK